VKERLIHVDPSAAELAIGCSWYRREVGEHAADAEAVNKTHRFFQLLGIGVGMAEDLIGRDVVGSSAGGDKEVDRLGEFGGGDFGAGTLLPLQRGTLKPQIESFKTCLNH